MVTYPSDDFLAKLDSIGVDLVSDDTSERVSRFVHRATGRTIKSRWVSDPGELLKDLAVFTGVDARVEMEDHLLKVIMETVSLIEEVA